MHPLFASSHHDGGQVDDDQDVGGDQPRRKATLSIREDGGGQEERKVGHPQGISFTIVRKSARPKPMRLPAMSVTRRPNKRLPGVA
jgi:hypothetical protein